MSPASYLKHYVDFANERPGINQVLFSMVTNQGPVGTEPNQRVAAASYAEGYLSSDNRGGISGRMRQYFSDRSYPERPPAPFNRNQTDDLGVEISLDSGPGRITLTAHSWGDGRQTLTDIHQHDEVLVATGGSIGNQTASALYVISLGKTIAPG